MLAHHDTSADAARPETEDRLLKFVQRPISRRVIACSVSPVECFEKDRESERPQVFRAHPPHPFVFSAAFYRIGSHYPCRPIGQFSQRAVLSDSPASGPQHCGDALVVATFSSDRQRRRVSPAAGESDMCPGSDVRNGQS